MNDRKKSLRLLLLVAFCMGTMLLNAQTVNYDFRNQPLKSVLKEVERQTGLSVIYKTDEVHETKKITANFENASLEDVLSAILDKELEYRLQNKMIVISRRSWQQQMAVAWKKITGTVTDSSGEPVIGASIQVKGTADGTITDMDGKFTMNVPIGSTLQISYIGYKMQAVSVGDRNVIAIKLQDDTEALDEVVVIGYGTQKKSSLTASVASVSPQDIMKQVAPSVASALQGRTPGVEVLQKGGEAGADVKILVRGAGTFGATEPLYVIDGAFSNNGLNSLNPNDIESLEILKDGSAAAIYGSRAANGVVLITTKHGKQGKTKVELSGSFSYQTPSKYLDFMNAEQYRNFANIVANNSGNVLPAPENLTPTHPEIDTDWQKLFLRNAPIYNINASISGGGENSTFNTSIGYFDQKGIMEFSGFKKYNARVNGSFKKGRLSVTENLAASFSSKEPQVRMTMGIPTAPVNDEWGRYVSVGPEYYINGPEGVVNPFASYSNTVRENKVIDVTGSLNIGLRLFKGLDYKLVMGGSYLAKHNYSRSLAFDSKWDDQGNAEDTYSRKLSSLSESRSESFNYTIDNILTYNNTFNKHTVDVMVGTSWMRDFYRDMGIGSADNDLGGPSVTVYNGKGDITGNELKSALLSFFGRVNYDYDNRYLLSASIRSDRSSKFAKGYQVGYFPSVSIGWNIHQEPFFHIDWISKMKIRASYGELGANFIDPYSFLSVAYGPISSVFGENQSSSSVLKGYVTRFAQENLTWETAISKNVALEMSFLNNSLYFTAEYFWKDNNDLLAPLLPLASSGQTIVTNGGTLPVFNSASVENKGFELTVGYRNHWGDWGLDVNANISTIKNKVKSLGEGVQPIKAEVMTSGAFNDRPTITKPGLPIGTFWGYRVTGIDDKGDFIFEDNNGMESGALTGRPDGKVDENDKTNIGSPHPDFTYGLNLALSYKNWDLTAFFQGTQGNDIFALMKFDWYFGGYNSAVLTDALNGWTPENKSTRLPIMKVENTSGGNGLPSTFYIEDGSYFRCKNLQIGYTFSPQFLRKIQIEKARVYVGCQNLFTITKYPLYDPEVSSNALFDRGVDGFWQAQESPHEATMNSRVYNIGFSVTF